VRPYGCRMRIIKPFLLPLAAVAILTGFAVWADSRPSLIGWPGWELAACYPGCFCEAFHAGGIAQPWSAYSNLFYILAGLMILATRERPPGDARANRMAAARGYIAGFGWAVIGIGVTSFIFHVTLTQIGRWLDYMGMYAFTLYALLYSLARLRRRDDAAFANARRVVVRRARLPADTARGIDPRSRADRSRGALAAPADADPNALPDRVAWMFLHRVLGQHGGRGRGAVRARQRVAVACAVAFPDGRLDGAAVCVLPVGTIGARRRRAHRRAPLQIRDTAIGAHRRAPLLSFLPQKAHNPQRIILCPLCIMWL